MNLLAIAISVLMSIGIATGSAGLATSTNSAILGTKTQVLAERSFSLEKRYNNKFVSDIFKDNILLTLAYMDGKVKSAADVNWTEIEKPQEFTLTLKPGELFTFHPDVLPQYIGKTLKTTNAHFNAADGFKTDGLYFGDGVCHIASLIYWAAKDAGLDAYRPAAHDFAVINEVPKEYGVSIFYVPGNTEANAHQNLYVVNNRQSDIRFVFTNDGTNLSVRIVE